MKMALCVLGALALSSEPGWTVADVNGGFESGDFNGWSVDNPFYPPGEFALYPSQIGSARVVNDPAHAFEGSHYALVEDFGASSFQPGPLRAITVSRSFDLVVGQILTGWAAFATMDYQPVDSGWVRVVDANGSLVSTLWSQHSGADASQYGDAFPPWTQWSWTAPSSQTYTLQYGISSTDDGLLGSSAYFDALAVSPNPKAPDPFSTAALMGLALLILGAFRSHLARKTAHTS